MSVQALSAQPFSRHMQILTDETQPDVVEAESPEAARRNHNYEVLRRIQGGLTELEGAISRLDSLIAESTRLATEVEKVAQQEAELLREESLSEATTGRPTTGSSLRPASSRSRTYCRLSTPRQ